MEVHRCGCCGCETMPFLSLVLISKGKVMCILYVQQLPIAPCLNFMFYNAVSAELV